jgi:hypothetical protein
MGAVGSFGESVHAAVSALPLPELQQAAAELDGAKKALHDLGSEHLDESERNVDRAIQSVADALGMLTLGQESLRDYLISIGWEGTVSGGQVSPVVQAVPVKSPPPTMPITAAEKPIAYEARAAKRRARFMEEVGHLHSEAGIDAAGADAFIASVGLNRSPARLTFTERDAPEVMDALRRAGVSGEHIRDLRDGSQGMYIETLGLTIIQRDLISPREAEGTIVHEETHGSLGVSPEPSVKEKMRGLVRKYSPVTKIWANRINVSPVLEEGFATLVELEYARHTQPKPDRWPDGERRHAYSQETDLYRNGAITWALLFQKVPDLAEATFVSRADPAAEQEIVNMINSIRPGLADRLLYGTLSRERPDEYEAADWMFYQIQAMHKGLDIALDATGFGAQDIPDICDNGEGAKYIAKKLREQEKQTSWRPKDMRP